MHVWIVLVMGDEVVRKVMMLIEVAGFALRWRRKIIDSLIEMRLIQFQEGRCRDGHTATTARL